MKDVRTLQLPLILTTEKKDLITSIIHILQEEGFMVLPFREDQISIHHCEERGMRVMDGRTILRYIRAHASKRNPIKIVLSDNSKNIMKPSIFSGCVAA